MRRYTPLKLLLLFALALAQVPAALPARAEDAGALSRSQVDSGLGIAAGLQVVSVLECFGYGQTWFTPLFLGTTSLQIVPAWIYGTAGARADTTAQASLDILCLGNESLDLDDYVAPLFINAAHKFSMFATYDTYMDMRRRCSDESYADSERSYSLGELLAAPFSPEALGRWYVLGYIGAIAGYEAARLALADQGSAVWSTGSSYLGRTEFPAALGTGLAFLAETANFTITAVGEESLYRGTYYEELKTGLGAWPARLIDATYFTASHYPQQIDSLSKEDATSVLVDFAASVSQALWLEAIYDWGGLRAAIAAHAWSDVILFMGDWLLAAGSSRGGDSGFSLDSRSPEGLSIGYTVRL